MLSLSILDQTPVSEGSKPELALQHTVELAQAAERLGYKRFGFLSTIFPGTWQGQVRRF